MHCSYHSLQIATCSLQAVTGSLMAETEVSYFDFTGYFMTRHLTM